MLNFLFRDQPNALNISLHSRIKHTASRCRAISSFVCPPCRKAARRDRSLPAFVLGPREAAPCMRHTVLPRTAHFRHRSFDLLLFAVHCATMIQGVQFSVFFLCPLPRRARREVLGNDRLALVVDVDHLHRLLSARAVF